MGRGCLQEGPGFRLCRALGSAGLLASRRPAQAPAGLWTKCKDLSSAEPPLAPRREPPVLGRVWCFCSKRYPQQVPCGVAAATGDDGSPGCPCAVVRRPWAGGPGQTGWAEAIRSCLLLWPGSWAGCAFADSSGQPWTTRRGLCRCG